jgi:ubiquinone/menaquinone biosynthesis C-methylase UbiE
MCGACKYTRASERGVDNILTFVQSPIEYWKQIDDEVLILYQMEHFVSTEQEIRFSECHRLLKPGGRIGNMHNRQQRQVKMVWNSHYVCADICKD